MPDGYYSVDVLLPPTSDYTPAKAAKHFRAMAWGQFTIRATAKKRDGATTGVRVTFDKWAIELWLNEGEEAAEFCREVATTRKNRPAKQADIAACQRYLAVDSDPDEGFEWTDEFNQVLDELRERFGGYVYDNYQGIWWL